MIKGRVDTLREVLQHLHPTESIIASAEANLEHLTSPVADAAWSCVRASTYKNTRLLDAIRHPFCEALVVRLSRTSRRVFQSGSVMVQGGKNNQVFDVILRTLQEYRGLARIWNAQLRGWMDFVLAFAEHTSAFLAEQRSGTEVPFLVRATTELSDPHNRGRSVTLIESQQVGTWFYKPRNGRREEAWFRLLQELNDAGFDLPFLIPRVLPRRDHSWMELVRDVEPRNLQERQALLYRVGALLYLAHFFRAVDLHRANFVLHGSHPVLVDCETLFHPETKLPPKVRVSEKSLARTGMLAPFAQSGGNPLVRLSRETETIRHGCAVLLFNPGDSELVTAGFAAMHSFLGTLRHRARRVTAAIGRLRGSRTRYVFRPTIFYDRIMEEALAPALLRPGAGLSRFLSLRLTNGLCAPAIVRREVSQLLNGDIPTFTGRPSSARRRLSSSEFHQALSGLRQALNSKDTQT